MWHVVRYDVYFENEKDAQEWMQSVRFGPTVKGFDVRRLGEVEFPQPDEVPA